MSPKALTEITEKPEATAADTNDWQPLKEFAPSVMQADVPTVARIIGVLSLVLLFAPGVMALIFDKAGTKAWIGPGVGIIMALFGLAGLLYHASRETELEWRRAYGVFALIWIGAAIAHALWPVQAGMGMAFLPWGYVCLLIGLPFGLAFVHNEEDTLWRSRAIYLIGGLGAILAVTGLIGGLIRVHFLLPYGLLLALAGLGYLWAYLSLEGTDSDRGYRIGTAIGILGALTALVALLLTFVYRFGWFGAVKDSSYLATAGFLLIGLGALYSFTALALVSDRTFMVLTRRELASYFFSPLAYFILVAFACLAWLDYWFFVSRALRMSEMNQPMVEPIIRNYIFGIIPVFFLMLAVPLLTMRLLSEERRTQTLEVLLTAPVEDSTVVLSKFMAVLIIFLLIWLPYGLYLIALRVEGGQPFDYRPLISFFLALTCSGAGMLSMGLFFSNLTRNQVAAAVVTALGMMLLLFVYFVRNWLLTANSAWYNLLGYFSFLDLWESSLSGRLALSDIIFHVSATVFWLFLTVQVLGARRWW